MIGPSLYILLGLMIQINPDSKQKNPNLDREIMSKGLQEAMARNMV
jgi:hypothetical protein